ncbi:MAG: cation-transporting P-type ATPase [Christensenellales bacterium]
MYRKTIEQTCNELGTDLKSGLTCAEVAARRERDGLNEIEGGKREPFILKLARQFADVLIIILLVAAAVSLIVDPSEWVDSLVILIVVAINAVLGVVQESRAEKSLDALKKCPRLRVKLSATAKRILFPRPNLFAAM